jgi:hypothetical protein
MNPETKSFEAAEREALRSGEIHIRMPTLGQLFDPIDPSPVTGKDLLPSVVEFIVSWGREIPARTPPTLVIHVDDPVPADEAGAATTGIHAFFASQAFAHSRKLRQILRVGRISLLIGLVVLGLSMVGGEALRAMDSPLAIAVGSTLEIGGWVAMWRPFEIFLYEWWPLLADIRLFHRLAAMDVRGVCDRVDFDA